MLTRVFVHNFKSSPSSLYELVDKNGVTEQVSAMRNDLFITVAPWPPSSSFIVQTALPNVTYYELIGECFMKGSGRLINLPVHLVFTTGLPRSQNSTYFLLVCNLISLNVSCPLTPNSFKDSSRHYGVYQLWFWSIVSLLLTEHMSNRRKSGTMFNTILKNGSFSWKLKTDI